MIKRSKIKWSNQSFVFICSYVCLFLTLHFFYKFYRLWCLWHCCCCKSYVRYECLPFGPKRSKGLLLYGHFMARFCAFFYSHQCGWASSSSSSSKAQWMLLLWYFSFSCLKKFDAIEVSSLKKYIVLVIRVHKIKGWI